MGKRNRNKNKITGGIDDREYWESDDYNSLCYFKNLNLLFTLALNRFRWEGLPDTCDARYLEKTLLRHGIATLSYKRDEPTRIYTTLEAAVTGEYNMYGYPLRWRAVGYANKTDYEVTPENGEICYYSFGRSDPWTAIDMYARKLAHFEVTENINLTAQMTPWLLVAPQEKKLEIINIFRQIVGGEPAIIGDETLLNLVDKIKAISLQVPLIVEELGQGYQNTFNQALLYLGIPHLAFEKGERMIEDEARANTAPTNIQILDCLQARRDFCDKVNRKFGLDIACYYNTDFESLNFNYLNNIEQMAQDGMIGGETDV